MSSSQLGEFRFDPATGVLSTNGGPIDIGRRGAALLAHLIERSGGVVTKQALIDAAWPGMAIEDSNLSVQIARLRKLIGSDAIETVGRIGYRLSNAAVRTTAPVAMPMVAVPRFVGLDAGGEVLARAITDDVVIGLSRFRTVTVTTVATAEDYLINGSVRTEGGRLRVAVQLLDGGGRVLWGERFDLGRRRGTAADKLADALVAQVEWQVQRAEMARVARMRPSESAYELFQRGRARLNVRLPDDNAAAIALFERALELDPHNVTIIAAACDARAVRISLGWAEDGMREDARCRDLARRGLAHRDGDPVANSMFGYGLFRTGELDRGMAVISRAVGQNQNSVQALALVGTAEMHWGDIGVAERHYRRGLRLAPDDPNQAQVMGGLSRIRMMQERYEDALDWAHRSLEINENYPGAQWTRVAANAKLGRMDEAREQLTEFRRRQPKVTVEVIRRAQTTRPGRMAATLEGLAAAGLPAE